MDVRCDYVRFAQGFYTQLGSQGGVVPVSGHAVNPSMGARSRLLSRTVLKQGPHPLGSVGKLDTVDSDRCARNTTETGVRLDLSETIPL